MWVNELKALVPDWVNEFLGKVIFQGMKPVLVGGAVRDVLMGSKTITDWDFEIHGADPKKYQLLLKTLGTRYELKPQAHHVYKAFFGQNELQFAPPRVEVYLPQEIYSHNDFESKIEWSLDFKNAGARRDFTINALGARFDGSSWTLLDPFEGQKHLSQKILYPCDKSHFRKDPVRLLRALRFRLKYNFSWSSELKEACESLDLGFVSPFYVGSEAQKSLKPFHFWNELQHYPTLPSKFQGGLLDPEGMHELYQKYLPEFGVSNSILSAVFMTGEGWHLLMPLAGKGENESTLWRHRRSYLLELKTEDHTKLDLQSDDIMNDAHFLLICQLMRPPFSWLNFSWVNDFLTQHQLTWILEKKWDDTLDVKVFPAKERHMRKVMAWLSSP